MKRHWPEYLIEAAGLGLFMLSAAGFATLLFHPESAGFAILPSEIARRTLMGLAMAGTAIVLVYSPWGQRSGAHFNPALTLTFAALGKVATRDAAAYVIAQFLGGVTGSMIAERLWGPWLGHPSVNHVATLPGPAGSVSAWFAEFAMAFVLMSVVLPSAASPQLRRYTGLFAAACLCLFITFESPISGMSLNPARSFASAVAARNLSDLWIYLTAPTLGMLAAGLIFASTRTPQGIPCAKLHHAKTTRCIFCEFAERRRAASAAMKNIVRFPPDSRLTRV